MTIYDDKPWLARYDPGQPAEIDRRVRQRAGHVLRGRVERDPDGDIIRYFDGRITLRELDDLTDAFAAGIVDAGFAPGERVAVYLQNVPQFVIAQIGTWKAGGIAVSINPMNRERELQRAPAGLRGVRAGVPAEPLPRRRGEGRCRAPTCAP